MFKIIANVAAENMGKKGGYQVWTDQTFVLILHEEGYSERQISGKLKISKTTI